MTTWFLPEQTVGLYDGGTSSTPSPIDSLFESIYEDVLGDNLTAPEISVRGNETVEIDVSPVPCDIEHPTFDDYLFARSAYKRSHVADVPLRERWTPIASIERRAAPSEVVTLHLNAGGVVSVPPFQEVPEVTTGGVLEKYTESKRLSPGSTVAIQNSIHPSDVDTEELSKIEVTPYSEYREQNLDDDSGKHIYGATLYTDTVSVNGIYLRA